MPAHRDPARMPVPPRLAAHRPWPAPFAPALLALSLIATPAAAQSVLPPDEASPAPAAPAASEAPPAAAPGLSMLFDEPAAPVEIEARPATPGAPPAWLRDGVMVDRLARGLYFYDRDTRPGRSTCYRTCRSLWPPLFAEADARPAGDFSVIERSDGTRQWAWQGKPLYRWVSDRRWGQADGDRVSGVWTLVRPTGADAAALPPFPDAP